jgi:hypothetical protein
MRLFLIWLILLSGCATEYAPPAGGGPTASLVLSTTTYGSAVFKGKSAAACPNSTPMNLAGFSFTLTGASLQESAKRISPTRLIAAGHPYYLSAEIAGTTCKLASVFVPSASVEYEAILHATNNRCGLSVYRRAAGGALAAEPTAGPVSQEKSLCQ